MIDPKKLKAGDVLVGTYPKNTKRIMDLGYKWIVNSEMNSNKRIDITCIARPERDGADMVGATRDIACYNHGSNTIAEAFLRFDLIPASLNITPFGKFINTIYEEEKNHGVL